MDAVLRFLGLYGGDILVCALIAAGVADVIHTMRRDKKAGKSACGGCDGCAGCACAGMCHGATDNK